jgi:hypothetical protein|tara:strand:+ start:1537 stop:1998 length:462 start_codon:yes stop_codon:yes gene_type:complete
MFKNNTILIISLFFLLSCGYSTIHSQNKNLNFTLTGLELNGDRETNNFIKSRLKKFLNNESEKNLKVSINTSYNKISVAKNLTGNTTDFKLIINLDLTVVNINTNVEKLASFSETFTIKKNENNYEQKNYENIIKNNMSQLLSNKIIYYLSKS